MVFTFSINEEGFKLRHIEVLDKQCIGMSRLYRSVDNDFTGIADIETHRNFSFQLVIEAFLYYNCVCLKKISVFNFVFLAIGKLICKP